MSKEIDNVLILTAAQQQQVLNDLTLLTRNIIPDQVKQYKWDQQ
jgi:hypothetical protein